MRDDLDNPWDVLARNKAHERKLKNWKVRIIPCGERRVHVKLDKPTKLCWQL